MHSLSSACQIASLQLVDAMHESQCVTVSRIRLDDEPSALRDKFAASTISNNVVQYK